VRQFGQENADRIAFHMWLQWLAETQLRRVQERALAAGMRIGLYLDLAVGVAPDGADTWCEPEAVLGQVRLGAPPDMVHEGGQDWGLAPLSPTALVQRGYEPFKDVLDALTRGAGAVRIDHVMGLKRLYLIPAEIEASNGAYLGYPLNGMLRALAEISQARRTIIIGEDLGTVPEGFRDVMHEAEIQGYRVFYFEREGDGRFRAPAAYSNRALACISTHDLPTLKGWWAASDIDENERLGITSSEGAAEARSTRANDRRLLLAALNEAGLLPQPMEAVLHEAHPCPTDLPETVAIATHALLAKAASRMFAVQIEDMAGKLEQANLPGTVDEHPNWRRKLPMSLDEIAATELFRAITSAVASERPSTP
jgi:4-alpha-glucanotransferase